MLELIRIKLSCLILVIIPDSRKYNNKVYDPKIGYPYQYFRREVLNDEKIMYRCRLMYLYILSVSQTAVLYVLSVMLPPSTGVTNIELVTFRNDYKIGQSNRMNVKLVEVSLPKVDKVMLTL